MKELAKIDDIDSSININDLLISYNTDSYAPIFLKHVNNIPLDDNELSQIPKIFMKFINNNQIIIDSNKIIRINNKIYISLSFQPIILSYLHRYHRSSTAMIQLCNTLFVMLNSTAVIRTFYSNCKIFDHKNESKLTNMETNIELYASNLSNVKFDIVSSDDDLNITEETNNESFIVKSKVKWDKLTLDYIMLSSKYGFLSKQQFNGYKGLCQYLIEKCVIENIKEYFIMVSNFMDLFSIEDLDNYFNNGLLDDEKILQSMNDNFKKECIIYATNLMIELKLSGEKMLNIIKSLFIMSKEELLDFKDKYSINIKSNGRHQYLKNHSSKNMAHFFQRLSNQRLWFFIT
uniref:DNA-directed RNA polymerase n=1 Tax=Strongyloides stercoralis TaxID=6248 RepID=A0A0K0EG41_STRER